MVSAASGDGVPDLKRDLAARMPEGPWHFPEDQVSDVPTRLLAAEITREQLYLKLHEELPYDSTVESENWEERRDGYAAIQDGRRVVMGKSWSVSVELRGRRSTKKKKKTKK